MKKLIPIVLTAALLLSACGQTAESAPAAARVTAEAVTTAETTAAPKTTPDGVDKAETVYAKAKADGTVTETTVEAVGPHDTLYRSCAEYRRMVDLQKLEDEAGGDTDD